jgi:hypothetical protein
MTDGDLIFPETEPYGLRATQDAIARDVGGNVQMSLSVVAPGKGPEPVLVHTSMTILVARKLANQLNAAADQAELGRA